MLAKRLKILKEIFPNYLFQEGKGEFITFCPHHEHHKKKLQINVKNNIFKCWVCGYSGNIVK